MLSSRTLLLSALLVAPTQAFAQAGFVVDVPGGREVQLALPRPEAAPAERALAEAVWSALDQGLRQSGYFTVLDPDATLDAGGPEPGSFSFDGWRKLNASVLVKTRVPPPSACGAPSTACVDAWIYYVVNGQLLSGNRFRVDQAHPRHLGHSVANEVLHAVTGHRGAFGGRLAAVGHDGRNKGIFLLDTDGHGVTPATRNSSINLSPALSPDGRYLAWTSYRKGNPDLFLKDLANGRVRALSDVDGINASPAFSPDGTLVAMTRSSGANADIFLLDARTGEVVRQLTNSPGIDVSPSFSPDGTQIAYASEASGGSQVYLADATTGANRRLTFQGNFNGDPVFSPDGTQIAFVGRDGGRFDVFVIGVDGQGLIRITQNMGDNEDPTWSPDGRYLVFSSTRDGGSHLWMATADGRHQARITRSGSWSQPAFVR